MNIGAKRQLPSWMVRTTATELASNSETKAKNKENDFVKPDTKLVEPLKKKVQSKKHENELPSIENDIQMLKKCEAITRKRKSNKYEEGHAERFEENESCLLKPCKISSNKRMASQPKHVEDQVDDFFESDLDKKEDDVLRKRARDKAPRKKPSEKLTGKFHDVTVETGPSEEDELTVEDLISIAEEYIKADRTNFQKSEVEQDTISLRKTDTQIGLGKHLTTHGENSMVTDQPVSSDSSLTKTVSSLTKPLSDERHISDSDTIDPTQSMLGLLLPRWKAIVEVEKKTDCFRDSVNHA